jgi:uncharacterized membrane protein
MNTLLVIVGFAVFFSFLALTQELHEIAQELQQSRCLFMELLDLLRARSSSEPF